MNVVTGRRGGTMKEMKSLSEAAAPIQRGARRKSGRNPAGPGFVETWDAKVFATGARTDDPQEALIANQLDSEAIE